MKAGAYRHPSSAMNEDENKEGAGSTGSSAGLSIGPGLAVETLKLVKNLFDIAALELVQAIKSLPAMALWSVLGIICAVVSWNALIFSASWLIYTTTNSALSGIIIFNLLQLLGAYTCYIRVKLFKRNLTLPITRECLTYLRGQINEAQDSSKS